MTYYIYLDNDKIGTTLLEKADAPMGIVFGEILLTEATISYDFLSKYCKDNNIKTEEYPDDKLISTLFIPMLKVVNENGIEIKGEGWYISGLDDDGFEINGEGIPYPFYEQEFPHHVKTYKEMYK